MNWPNLITLFRLLCAPIIVNLILVNNLFLAFFLFLLAALSDGLDGYLARTLGARTKLGSILDPLADKVLLIGVYFVMAIVGYLSYWVASIVIFRDLLILGGATLFFLFERPVEVHPLFVSKVNTLAQFILVFFLLGAGAFDVAVPDVIAQSAQAIVVILTILSGASYVSLWLKRMRDYVQ